MKLAFWKTTIEEKKQEQLADAQSELLRCLIMEEEIKAQKIMLQARIKRLTPKPAKNVTALQHKQQAVQ